MLEKLHQVLEGFEDAANQTHANTGVTMEPLFIFIGSFVSKPIVRTMGGREVVKNIFTVLADTICKFRHLSQHAKFLIIPGPLDAGSSVAYPRRAIPKVFTEYITEKVKYVTFASNPCRVRYYTQEIVLFRENLLKKMQKHLVVSVRVNNSSIVSSNEENIPDVTEQLVEAICDQAHLCPVPLQASPIHWELDHSLRLNPLPHLVRYALPCA